MVQLEAFGELEISWIFKIKRWQVYYGLLLQVRKHVIIYAIIGQQTAIKMPKSYEL